MNINTRCKEKRLRNLFLCGLVLMVGTTGLNPAKAISHAEVTLIMLRHAKIETGGHTFLSNNIKPAMEALSAKILPKDIPDLVDMLMHDIEKTYSPSDFKIVVLFALFDGKNLNGEGRKALYALLNEPNTKKRHFYEQYYFKLLFQRSNIRPQNHLAILYAERQWWLAALDQQCDKTAQQQTVIGRPEMGFSATLEEIKIQKLAKEWGEDVIEGHCQYSPTLQKAHIQKAAAWKDHCGINPDGLPSHWQIKTLGANREKPFQDCAKRETTP